MEKIKNFFFTNQSVKQTVVKNTFWLFASESISRLLKMALVVYAARILGTNGWGTFSYALSLGSLLMIFSDIGLGTIITRHASQKEDGYKSFIGSALVLKGLVLSVSTIFLVLAAPIFSNIESANHLFPLIAIILFFDSLRDIGLAMNMSSQKMEREMIVKVVMNLVVLGLGVLLLQINSIPWSVAIAYAVGSAVGFILVLLTAKNDLIKMISKPSKSYFKQVLTSAIPFAQISLLTIALTNVDIFMLGIWSNATEIGLYAASQRIQQFILIIPIMLATAIFPTLSQLADKDNLRFSKIVEKSLSILFTISIPLSVSAIIMAEDIILLFYGTEYLSSQFMLQILFSGLIITFPLALLSNALFALHLQKKILLSYVLGFSVNVLLNFILIPIYGASGAAFTFVLSGVVINFCIWYVLKKHLRIKILPKLLNILIGTIFVVAYLLIGTRFEIPFITNAVISIIIYMVALWVTKDSALIELRNLYKNHEQN